MDYQSQLQLLEEEHLKFQPYAWPHLVNHFRMFKLALRYGDYKEALGQIPRMILAMPGSWLGLAPKGNVGTTRMGIFEKKN